MRVKIRSAELCFRIVQVLDPYAVRISTNMHPYFGREVDVREAPVREQYEQIDQGVKLWWHISFIEPDSFADAGDNGAYIKAQLYSTRIAEILGSPAWENGF